MTTNDSETVPLPNVPPEMVPWAMALSTALRSVMSRYPSLRATAILVPYGAPTTPMVLGNVPEAVLPAPPRPGADAEENETPVVLLQEPMEAP